MIVTLSEMPNVNRNERRINIDINTDYSCHAERSAPSSTDGTGKHLVSMRPFTTFRVTVIRIAITFYYLIRSAIEHIAPYGSADEFRVQCDLIDTCQCLGYRTFLFCFRSQIVEGLRVDAGHVCFAS